VSPKSNKRNTHFGFLAGAGLLASRRVLPVFFGVVAGTRGWVDCVVDFDDVLDHWAIVLRVA
jgi:hypothetical protein